MIKLHIDHRTDTPIYLQLVDQVLALIETSELKPGDQLPTVRTIAQDLRINFNTVSRAYRLLDQAGIISTQQGRGTYILEPSNSATQQLIRAEEIDQVVEQFLIKLNKLGVTPHQAVELIRSRTNQDK